MSRYLPHVLFVVLCEAAGAVAGGLTRTSVNTWYRTLDLPWFTPPDWVFAPAWITLYALMGIAAGMVWTRRADTPAGRRALAAFAGQLVLNVGWTLVFFGLQSVTGGLAVIVALWVAIALTMRAFARVYRPAAALLIPYLLWVSYAVALNLGIWL